MSALSSDNTTSSSDQQLDHPNNKSDGRLVRPDQQPFSVGFSKEHPSEHKAFTGSSDDLLVPFCRSVQAVCYHDLYVQGKEYGIVEPCPNAPLFANCTILFEAMHNKENENYELYRKFVSWWTDAIARMILTGGIEDGIHFNLAGYSKERIQVVKDRYFSLMENDENVKWLEYEFVKNYNTSGRYRHVPHLKFNTKWTEEEKAIMNCPNDLYPGFTDWDLGVILRDDLLLSKCSFYCVNSVHDLTNYKKLSKEELKEQFGIDIQ
ncbi:predicted protein [Naegleria gruberi]|uniref:Predicted protein n=1 Tax=Naegleria gruberi TaxID=5762 RepID=D2VZU5_NAEGR|nr:uncharacterized protein NAEGRDRAFT_74621 [Naegleria gruberi]EFC37633.1 predicted protein [Naegleria gruberi]|eukprot:XP_002670377.1 predicted protein [Naegleria gruberi strain NEG-M]